MNYISNGYCYKIDKRKKGGVSGEVVFFKYVGDLTGKERILSAPINLVKKKVLAGIYALNTNDVNDLIKNVDMEVQLFNKAYSHFGAPFFSLGQACRVRTKTELSVIMPMITGISLEEFMNGKAFGEIEPNSYCDNEVSIFESVFHKLRDLFNINISHGDLNIGNIMIINSFFEIFFIDFVEAITWTDEEMENSIKKNIIFDIISNSIMSDIVRVIYGIFVCRYLYESKIDKRYNYQTNTVTKIIDRYYLEDLFKDYRIDLKSVYKKIKFYWSYSGSKLGVSKPQWS
ncbi:MAG: hypothetical protein GY750_11685 [Lentisphaerae bacterium]|nr:hypothetical protein [Lentisphaerota bacterium]MCP4102076.1 hypothetical protein [Lentisphaerota bacterium]